MHRVIPRKLVFTRPCHRKMTQSIWKHFAFAFRMIVSHFHAAIHSTHPILFVKRCKYKTNKYKFSGLLCRSSVTQCTWEWRCNCHNNDTLTNTYYKHMLSGYRLFETTTLSFWCVLSSYKYPQYIQIYNLRKLYIGGMAKSRSQFSVYRNWLGQ